MKQMSYDKNLEVLKQILFSYILLKIIERPRLWNAGILAQHLNFAKHGPSFSAAYAQKSRIIVTYFHAIVCFNSVSNTHTPPPKKQQQNSNTQNTFKRHWVV